MLPEDSGSLNTCEDLNMRTDSMYNYGWSTADYTDPYTGKTWPARGTSYGQNFNYCNIDDGKYSTIRNGSENASLYVAELITLIMELN